MKLRAGIARGRSYASVLITPRRKMDLCEALRGRRPWPELELPCEPMGSSSERGRWRGRGGGGAARGSMGRGRAAGGAARSSWLLGAAVLYVRNRKKEGGRINRVEKKRKEMKREKKEKNWKIFQT
jgi:hypothetical protein